MPHKNSKDKIQHMKKKHSPNRNAIKLAQKLINDPAIEDKDLVYDLPISKKDMVSSNDFMMGIPVISTEPDKKAEWTIYRTFQVKGGTIDIEAYPATVTQGGKSGKSTKVKLRHLGKREYFVLTCLIDLLVKGGLVYHRKLFENDYGKTYSFVLSDLKDELSKVGSTMSIYQIKEAIMTLANVHIRYISQDSSIDYGSYIEKYHYQGVSKHASAICYIQFNTYIQKSFEESDLRIFNRKYLTSLKSVISIYLHNLILRVIQGRYKNKEEKFVYRLRLSTTLNALDMAINKDSIIQFEKALRTLVDNGVLEESSLNRQEILKRGRKIIDIIYGLTITDSYDKVLAKSHSLKKHKDFLINP